MIFAPRYGAELLGAPQAPEADVVSRVFAVRALVLGGFYWSARSNLARSLLKGDGPGIHQAKRDLSRVLWFGIFVDCLDVLCALPGIFSGELKGRIVPLFTGGGVTLVGLGVLALKKL
jgi:hypothetical protein